jgi:hypothetical protein
MLRALPFPQRVKPLIIEIENLTKIYESKLRVVAVNGIDLELKQGGNLRAAKPLRLKRRQAANLGCQLMLIPESSS